MSPFSPSSLKLCPPFPKNNSFQHLSEKSLTATVLGALQVHGGWAIPVFSPFTLLDIPRPYLHYTTILFFDFVLFFVLSTSK